MKPFVWKPARGRFATGEDLHIGKVIVGSYALKLGKKGDPTLYRAFVNLPTINLKEGTQDWSTVDQAKARVERAVRVWFEWLDKEGD